MRGWCKSILLLELVFFRRYSWRSLAWNLRRFSLGLDLDLGFSCLAIFWSDDGRRALIHLILSTSHFLFHLVSCPNYKGFLILLILHCVVFLSFSCSRLFLSLLVRLNPNEGHL
jgi:hypothetical protein